MAKSKRKSRKKSRKVKNVRRKSYKMSKRKRRKSMGKRAKRSQSTKSRRKSRRKRNRNRRKYNLAKDVTLENVKPLFNMTIEAYTDMLKREIVPEDLYIDVPTKKNTAPTEIYLRSSDDKSGTILFQGKLIRDKNGNFIVKNIEPTSNYKSPQIDIVPDSIQQSFLKRWRNQGQPDNRI